MNDKGYYNITDDKTGKVFAVERATGELYETVNVDMPIGSIYYTPEQQRKYKEKKERERKKQMCISNANKLGKFYFVLSDERFSELAPETVARLIYLNTFINYNDNKLMLSKRTHMKYKDLSSVLGVSKATVSRFWKEVSPRYITKHDNDLMITNNAVFNRGYLPQKQYTAYQKFYIDGVRKLYENAERKYHKQLGYLFKLLLFINIEYNLLCYPECTLETDINNIELISMADFCNWIGYDIKHLNALIDTYRNIYFDVNGRQERFCTFIYDGVNKRGAKICINPHILYSGSDYSKVEVLGAFYKT